MHGRWSWDPHGKLARETRYSGVLRVQTRVLASMYKLRIIADDATGLHMHTHTYMRPYTDEHGHTCVCLLHILHMRKEYYTSFFFLRSPGIPFVVLFPRRSSSHLLLGVHMNVKYLNTSFLEQVSCSSLQIGLTSWFK